VLATITRASALNPAPANRAAVLALLIADRAENSAVIVNCAVETTVIVDAPRRAAVIVSDGAGASMAIALVDSSGDITFSRPAEFTVTAAVATSRGYAVRCACEAMASDEDAKSLPVMTGLRRRTVVGFASPCRRKIVGIAVRLSTC